MLGVNLDGFFHSMQPELAVMEPAGAGSIVNVSSVLGSVGNAGAGAYVASKHGVVGLTRAAALDYAQNPIVANGGAGRGRRRRDAMTSAPRTGAA